MPKGRAPLPNRRCCARSADDGTDWNLFVDLESGLILLTEKAIVLDYRFEGGQTGGTGDFIGQMADEVQPAERTYSLAGAIARHQQADVAVEQDPLDES